MKNTNVNAAIRQEASNGEIWLPLPSDIVRYIYSNIGSSILGAFSPNNKKLTADKQANNGIIALNDSKSLCCFVVRSADIKGLRKLFDEKDSVVPPSENEEEVLSNRDKLDKYNQQLANYIAIGVTDYSADDISTLIERHYAENAGCVFRSETSNVSGTVRLKSHSTPSHNSTIPASHPVMIPKTEADVSRAHKSSRFLNTARLNVSAAFNTSTSTVGVGIGQAVNRRSDENYVPNANANPMLSDPLKQMASNDGMVTWYELGDNKISPIMRAGKGFYGDTAEKRQYGTHRVTTIDGLSSNDQIGRPSAHFFPKDFWQATLFTSPFASIFSSPANLAVIVAVALGMFPNQEDKEFKKNYKKTESIIDNSEVDKDLYG